jgi:hypothetical protein
MDKPKTLTPKQAAFAGFVAKGHSYTDAYRKAYDGNGSNASIAVEAERIERFDCRRSLAYDEEGTHTPSRRGS